MLIDDFMRGVAVLRRSSGPQGFSVNHNRLDDATQGQWFKPRREGQGIGSQVYLDCEPPTTFDRPDIHTAAANGELRMRDYLPGTNTGQYDELLAATQDGVPGIAPN